MNDITKELKLIDAQLEDLRELDVSHDSLGVNGFQEANKVKNEFCEKVSNILARYKEVSDRIPKHIATNAVNQSKKIISNINQVCTQINQLAEQGIHNSNYPVQRDGFIANLNKYSNSLEGSLTPLISEIRISELEKSRFSSSAKELEEELKDKLKAVTKYIEQAKSKANALSSASAGKAAADSGSVFSNISTGHRDRENRWFAAFVVFSMLLIAAVIYIISYDVLNVDDLPQTVADIFKRLLALSTAGIGMKVSLKKYNLERNLRIIYDHRTTALNNYAVLEAAIFDDPERQNQLRLEIAKYVFTDPETGYKGDASNSNEVSINPVLNTFENVSKKLTQ